MFSGIGMIYATQGCIQDPLGPENSLKSIDFTGPWNTYASDATNGETGGNLRCFILNEGFFCLNKREISEIHIEEIIINVTARSHWHLYLTL